MEMLSRWFKSSPEKTEQEIVNDLLKTFDLDDFDQIAHGCQYNEGLFIRSTYNSNHYYYFSSGDEVTCKAWLAQRDSRNPDNKVLRVLLQDLLVSLEVKKGSLGDLDL
jgi:hypothetical protein